MADKSAPVAAKILDIIQQQLPHTSVPVPL